MDLAIFVKKLAILMQKHIISILLGIFSILPLCSCSNSESINFANNGYSSSSEDVPSDSITEKKIDSADNECDSSYTIPYLPLDDSEYPYGGIPRIVIETDDFRQIRDRETKIPAKLQIWGEKAPESEIIELTIKGRGNSSWENMPKKSYKLELKNKLSILNLPKEKDWALIANYIDKSLLRNSITHSLAESIEVPFTPKQVSVELYLNREYMGVYLFTETIKVSNNRVNIPNVSNSYLVEFDEKFKEDEIITTTKNNRILNIHSPKNADSAIVAKLRTHISTIEDYIFNSTITINSLTQYIDIESYLKFYWIEELSKNNDGAFFTSVFFSWIEGQPLQMGPVWDFDQAYGNHPNIELHNPKEWFIRDYYWNKTLFKDTSFIQIAQKTWQEIQTKLETIIDSIDIYKRNMSIAAKNNFKKWPILYDKRSYKAWASQRYNSYEEAVDDLKKWIISRKEWIDSEEIIKQSSTF